MPPAQALLDAVPRGYSGSRHLAIINLAGAGGIGLCLARLSAPTAGELALVPAFFVFANLFEWWIHRGPMHHPTALRILYRRHTLTHHAAFDHEHMEVGGPRDLALVLFPPWFPPLAAALVSPVPIVLTLLGSANLGGLFFASALSYYVVYEWFHMLHHLPRRGPLHRFAIVRRLVAGHTRHHDPALMTRGNFNVSFPLWDLILGTWLADGERGARGGGGAP